MRLDQFIQACRDCVSPIYPLLLLILMEWRMELYSFPMSFSTGAQKLHMQNRKCMQCFLRDLNKGQKRSPWSFIRMLIQLKYKPWKHDPGKEGQPRLVGILQLYAHGEASLFTFSCCLQLYCSMPSSALSPPFGRDYAREAASNDR